MHRSCSENRHGRLASWENHYTLHPLANKERNISQHFPGGKKAALAKTDSERSWDDALSEKVQIAMMEFTKWDLGVTNWCMITWLFHLPVSGMQRSYFEGVAAQDTPGFFVGNDCMGRGRGRCSFDMSWPSSGFATSPLVHKNGRWASNLCSGESCAGRLSCSFFKLNIFVELFPTCFQLAEHAAHHFLKGWRSPWHHPWHSPWHQEMVPNISWVHHLQHHPLLSVARLNTQFFWTSCQGKANVLGTNCFEIKYIAMPKMGKFSSQTRI